MRAKPAPVVGIDGYAGGWVAARLHEGRITWRCAPISEIEALLEPGATTGIDMPIGLLTEGERACDVLARQQLPGAASRVFLTPPRRVLELGLTPPNETVQALSRKLMGKGVSRQALGLASRILALDAALAGTDITVVEVHPELSFAELAGRVMHSKKSARGVGQRLAVLTNQLPDVLGALGNAPADVPIDDALDALAVTWSAQRWQASRARTLPPESVERPFIAV
jgi:predicted RNase H-like nuclease